jgi:DNA polymerase-3 subunit alpha
MSLAIKASAQFEGNAIRLTAHQIEPLERLAARSAAGLKVYMDTTDGLASLHLALTGGNVDGRRNGGLVKVISRLDAVTEVEIDLPGRYVISPEIMKAVKAIPGIAEVREL